MLAKFGSCNWFASGSVFFLLSILFLRWLCSAPGLAPDGCLQPCQDPNDGVMCDACYCEAFSDGIIKQPINTWSNLGFVSVGLAVLFHMTFATPFARNRFTEIPFYGVLYGFVGIWLGPGSMMFHGSFTALGGDLDSSSMDMWIGLVIAYNFVRMFGLRVWAVCLIYVGIVLAAVLLKPVIGSDIIFAVLVVVGILSVVVVVCMRREDVAWRSLQWFVWAVLVFLLGWLVWMQSQTNGPWCFPDSIWQGHAFWHLASAAAVAFAFVYFWLAPDRK
eukprot:TRINITY_DN11520_c0_g1_i1.p1 TRINITY_DN11520_c0_g1~~TRINITY_DN11520_c0_g1_i1.p1  ORF type:complete len:275 (-),score=59.02 TRINITY_DN11520_c0_g1_i1:56-880(-)